MLHIAAGALLGGVISTAITAARDYLDDKKFNSGWKEYAGSFAEGAIAGGVGAATGGASIFATKVAGAGAGFAGNITKQLITKGKVNWKEAAISTAIDAGIAVAGNYAGKIVKNSKVGKYLASKAADLAEKAKKQAVDLVLKGKAFNQAWKESKPNTVTLGSGFGALQSGINRTKIAVKKVAEGGKDIIPNKGFGSFNDLKSHLGSPGEGNQWHHFVEQSQIGKRANFTFEQVNNVNNVIAIHSGSGSIHSKISGHYSSKFDFTNGQTVRDWLSTNSFEKQFEYGKELLEEFGDVIKTDKGWVFKPFE